MFYPIQLTEESINLVIGALRKLPHEQVHDLVVDIATQAEKAKIWAQPVASNPPKKPRKPRTPRAPKPAIVEQAS